MLTLDELLKLCAAVGAALAQHRLALLHPRRGHEAQRVADLGVQVDAQLGIGGGGLKAGDGVGHIQISLVLARLGQQPLACQRRQLLVGQVGVGLGGRLRLLCHLRHWLPRLVLRLHCKKNDGGRQQHERHGQGAGKPLVASAQLDGRGGLVGAKAACSSARRRCSSARACAPASSR